MIKNYFNRLLKLQRKTIFIICLVITAIGVGGYYGFKKHFGAKLDKNNENVEKGKNAVKNTGDKVGNAAKTTDAFFKGPAPDTAKGVKKAAESVEGFFNDAKEKNIIGKTDNALTSFDNGCKSASDFFNKITPLISANICGGVPFACSMIALAICYGDLNGMGKIAWTVLTAVGSSVFAYLGFTYASSASPPKKQPDTPPKT